MCFLCCCWGFTQPRIPEEYLKPQNPATAPKVDLRKLRRLILDGKLAPCYPGGEEPGQAVGGAPAAAPPEECPICFMFFPVLNTSKCCSKRVCTECFLQVQTSSGGPSPTLCPWCKSNGYTARLVGVRTDAERAVDHAEDQKVIEARIREREAEILRDQERALQRIQQQHQQRQHQQEQQAQQPPAAAAGALDSAAGGPPPRRLPPLFGGSGGSGSAAAASSSGAPASPSSAGAATPGSASRSRSAASSSSGLHGSSSTRQAGAVTPPGVRQRSGGHAPEGSSGGGGHAPHGSRGHHHRAQSQSQSLAASSGGGHASEGTDPAALHRQRGGEEDAHFKMTDFIPHGVANMAVSVDDMNDFMLEQAMYDSISAANRSRPAATAQRVPAPLSPPPPTETPRASESDCITPHSVAIAAAFAAAAASRALSPRATARAAAAAANVPPADEASTSAPAPPSPTDAQSHSPSSPLLGQAGSGGRRRGGGGVDQGPNLPSDTPSAAKLAATEEGKLLGLALEASFKELMAARVAEAVSARVNGPGGGQGGSGTGGLPPGSEARGAEQ